MLDSVFKISGINQFPYHQNVLVNKKKTLADKIVVIYVSMGQELWFSFFGYKF